MLPFMLSGPVWLSISLVGVTERPPTSLFSFAGCSYTSRIGGILVGSVGGLCCGTSWSYALRSKRIRFGPGGRESGGWKGTAKLYTLWELRTQPRVCLPCR